MRARLKLTTMRFSELEPGDLYTTSLPASGLDAKPFTSQTIHIRTNILLTDVCYDHLVYKLKVIREGDK